MSFSRALGLYIHWPYCARICPYCDFNVYRPKGAEDALLEAILDDMRGWRERTGARRLTSLHFGGGTPSLLSVSALQRLIDAAGRVWGFVDNPEIGLEANPNDSVVFVDYASGGINRLSVGVQSFDAGALERLFVQDAGDDLGDAAVEDAHRQNHRAEFYDPRIVDVQQDGRHAEAHQTQWCWIGKSVLCHITPPFKR